MCGMSDSLEDIERRLVAVLREVKTLRARVAQDSQGGTVPVWARTLDEDEYNLLTRQIAGAHSAAC